jgi:MarR family transcriptional regulator, lower aerobic nicotinate degradation pathway regulator
MIERADNGLDGGYADGEPMAEATAKTQSAAPPGVGKWPGFQVFKCGWWLQLRSEIELEPLGINGRDFLVLTMLDADATLSQQQMATYMTLDPTQMVAVIDGLERDGLCKRTRNPEDRRRYAIQITSKGRHLLVRALNVVERIDEEIFAPLSAREREQLMDMMDRVMEPYWSEKIVPPRGRRG